MAFFLGPKTDANFINQAMYRDGQGLFPVPLAGPSKLPEKFLEKTPDISADTKHFLFRPFAGKTNNILDQVVVEDYFKARSDWKPKAGVRCRACPPSQRRPARGRAQLREGACRGLLDHRRADLERLGA